MEKERSRDFRTNHMGVVLTRDYPFPTDETITGALASMGININNAAKTVLVERFLNPNASTYPSEVVTVLIDNGSIFEILFKYETDDGGFSEGQRGGIAYEEFVYREVLSRVPVSTISFFGSFLNPLVQRRGIALQYVRNVLRLNKSENPRALFAAALWIGQFHAAAASITNQLNNVRINRYNKTYYRDWARRTLRLAREYGRESRWLEQICHRAEVCLGLLADEGLTIIHGEYYPKNILIREDDVIPIDWETAAVAAGEIDLATLTEGWEDDAILRCEEIYAETRWGSGTPSDFQRRLALARLYCQFRWLGDREAFETKSAPEHRTAQLRLLGKRLGLI